jgi:hypothetical protein
MSGGAADAGFRDYVRGARRVLDVALEMQLQSVLGGAVGGDGTSLPSALNEGKKIRGCLACLVGEALGAAFDAVVPRAVAVELIHAATLIHDDYVDQDTTRRNRPAVWTLEGARRAVLIGDVIFATAIKTMSDLGSEDGSAAARAIALVSKGALREPLDALNLASLVEANRIDGDLYGEIIRLKTGVLFGIACEFGAIAAGADANVRESVYTYGVCTGEAYQIADDLKEVEHHLASRRIGPKQMVPLAPPFLRSAPDMRPYIVECLRGGEIVLDENGVALIRLVKKEMEREIEERLLSAEAGVEGILTPSAAARLVLSAPRATIGMFNEA